MSAAPVVDLRRSNVSSRYFLFLTLPSVKNTPICAGMNAEGGTGGISEGGGDSGSDETSEEEEEETSLTSEEDEEKVSLASDDELSGSGTTTSVGNTGVSGCTGEAGASEEDGEDGSLNADDELSEKGMTTGAVSELSDENSEDDELDSLSPEEDNASPPSSGAACSVSSVKIGTVSHPAALLLSGGLQ
jgi:hypothetical protein